jgi:hypothetical protein
MLTICVWARQSWFAELAALDLAGDHVRDTLATYLLEVLACVLVLIKAERVGDAFFSDAYGTLALGWRQLLWLCYFDCLLGWCF